jgi:hypothetical protein
MLICRVSPIVWLVFPDKEGPRRIYIVLKETKKMNLFEGEKIVKEKIKCVD